jgi:hypothetical protein
MNEDLKNVKVNESVKRIPVKNVKVMGVTSPANVARIARERGINPQEVFVRVTFEHEGEQYTASNKLYILGKDIYQKLLNIMGTDEKINIELSISKVDPTNAFIYVEEDSVDVDSLFTEEVKRTDTRSSLSSLLNKLGA